MTNERLIRPTVVDGAAGVAGEDELLGAVVAERFKIEALLGEGGIGRVYLATQLLLDRKAAVKVLHPHLSTRGDVMMRFEREARAASRLNHPGSVTVYDFGHWQGQLYIAMEYLEGRSLADVIRQEFPLNAERVIDITAQLCDVLEAAHRMHLLHRDLKPENILLVTSPVDGREAVKVVDFGLAFVVGEQREARLTRDDAVSGTPCFMSPEQVLNRPLDARSDIYALGCVMYEMLTGAPPFDAPTSMEVLTMQLYDEAQLPSQRVKHAIPRELEQVVMWTLQKTPSNRPQHCGELRAALFRAMSPRSRPNQRPGLDTNALLDREARATAAGIAPRTATPADDTIVGHSAVLLVEPEGTTFTDSVAAVLRAHGALVKVSSVLEGTGDVEAVVIDVTASGTAGVLALKTWLAGATVPVVVVGPDEDFDAMAKALELGVAEYVPTGQRASLPRKVRRAIERARRGKR
ncbi:MAG: serine/threonine-protein kinase [Myxococcota bacterium]